MVSDGVSDIFSNLLKLLKDVDSIYKQNQFLEESYQLIQPKEIALGHRIDQHYSNVNDQSSSVSIVESFQYVSIKSSAGARPTEAPPENFTWGPLYPQAE